MSISFSFAEVLHKGTDTLGGNIVFIENKGQWEQPFLFKAELPIGQMFLFNNKIVFDLRDKAMVAELLHFKMLPDDEKKIRKQPNNIINAHCYEMEFVGAKTDLLEKYNQTSQYYNFYLGNDDSRWKSNVYGYKSINYINLYKGIDLGLTENEGFLKYEFYVSSSANPGDIKIKYNGIDNIKLDNGNIVLSTSLGNIVEMRPLAWQIINNDTVFVQCDFLLQGKFVSFKLGNNYNRNYDLVIDPIIVFGTYSGSTADNWGYTATYDQQGNVYAGGVVFGMGYPTTVGAYQTTYGGNVDIAISKYNTTGTSLIYSTYLGGSGPDVPNSIVVNSANELYVFATTGSSNYPTTPGCIDNSFNGGTSYTLTYIINFSNGCDLGITCFNAAGTSLLASTYFGGSGNDGLSMDVNLKHNYADDVRGEILLDENSNVYVVGSTASHNFPTTSGVFQPGYGGGSQDGFIIKLDRLLTTTLWSSYLGGSSADAIYSISLNEFNVPSVAGGTSSTNFPTTSTALMPTYQGGVSDGFISLIQSDGTSILRSTYWGTSAYDQVYFVETDKQNNFYVFGQSSSTGSVLIQNAAWHTIGGGQFISKINKMLNTVVWSTRFGTGNGVVNISPTAFLVDYCHNIYLSGWGSPYLNGFGGTAGLPITANAFQTTTDNNDYYFLCMRDDASGIVFGSFYGGSSSEHVDGGTSRFDRLGRIYQSVCAGCGGLDDFPTTPGAWSNTNNSSNCNNGVIKIDFSLPAIVADFNMPNVICLPFTVNFINTSYFPNPGLATCFWDFGNGVTSTNCNPSYSYTSSGIYNVTLIVSDATSCNSSDTITKQIIVLSSSTDTLNDVGICIGDMTQIGILPFSDPNISLHWYPSAYLSNANISNPTANPPTTTNYYLVISNGVCQDTIYQTVNVYDLIVDAGNDTVTCSPGLILTASYSGGTNFTVHWSSNPNFTDTLNNYPNGKTCATIHSAPHTYYVQVSNGYCTKTDEVFVDYQEINMNVNVTKPLCYGDSNGIITTNPTGGVAPYTFIWNNGETTQNIYNLASGLYSVTTYDASGCQQVSTILVDQPQFLSYIGENGDVNCDVACNGYVYGTTIGGTPPYNYAWNNGQNTEDLNNICQGVYSLTISDSHNCIHQDIFNIEVDYIYDSVFVWSDDDTIYQGQSTMIHATEIPGVFYTWSPTESLTNNHSANTDASPLQTTTYTVVLNDGYGCIYTDTVKIVVLDVYCYDPYIYIPNSFTPNGDGINDVLYIRSRYIDHMYFVIFDRWGEKVFETNDPTKGWDGTFRGKLLNPAVFDYYLEIDCYNHVQFIKKGNITLLR
jgi:gliding motility-associated-like protein